MTPLTFLKWTGVVLVLLVGAIFAGAALNVLYWQIKERRAQERIRVEIRDRLATQAKAEGEALLKMLRASGPLKNDDLKPPDDKEPS